MQPPTNTWFSSRATVFWLPDQPPKPIWTGLEEAYIASELDFNKLFNLFGLSNLVP